MPPRVLSWTGVRFSAPPPPTPAAPLRAVLLRDPLALAGGSTASFGLSFTVSPPGIDNVGGIRPREGCSGAEKGREMPRRTWGFTPDEWNAMSAELERLLADAASRRSTVTYGEVARRVFGGRVSARSSALMDLLGDVDARTDTGTGIMIASLVVRADSGIPGEGYFHFAREELGRPIDDPREFWEAEVDRVWAAYAPRDTGGHDGPR
jgi:hypothetical protein